MKVAKYLSVFLMIFSFQTLQAQRKFFNLVQVSPHVGYQRSYLDWSIAGTPEGTSPNVLSELIWKDIASENVGIGAKFFIYKGLYAEGSVSRLKTLNGFANDADYSHDDRERNTNDYNQNFKSNQGNSLQYHYDVGYQFSILKNIYLGAQIGGMYNSQLYYLLDFEPSDDDFPQQRSTYQTFWKGWQGKLQLRFEKNKWAFILGQTFQYLDYAAKANWVLITDFAHPLSFAHTATANGWQTECEISYKIYSQLTLSAQSQLGKISTAKGIDKLYRSNGDVSFTRLNAANLRFYNVQLNFNFQF